MNIKICGITTMDDAVDAVTLGVDALGFIFYEKSPRYVAPEKAEQIIKALPPFVKVVGVFVNQSKAEIDEIARRCFLDLIQLHGDESPEFCSQMIRRVLKAFKVAELDDLSGIAAYRDVVSGVLLDTKIPNMEGGTGKTFDWGLALRAKNVGVPVVLAGGINSSNVKKAIQLVNPYAIDLSSGVESSPGKKDYNKMQEMVKIAKTM
ncbi:MAG: phosphoribosylanthranilate isomerase [Candidatus Margulisiibacteriota bacterium]